jgi:hypothetical protein
VRVWFSVTTAAPNTRPISVTSRKRWAVRIGITPADDGLRVCGVSGLPQASTVPALEIQVNHLVAMTRQAAHANRDTPSIPTRPSPVPFSTCVARRAQ